MLPQDIDGLEELDDGDIDALVEWIPHLSLQSSHTPLAVTSVDAVTDQIHVAAYCKTYHNTSENTIATAAIGAVVVGSVAIRATTSPLSHSVTTDHPANCDANTIAAIATATTISDTVTTSTGSDIATTCARASRVQQGKRGGKLRIAHSRGTCCRLRTGTGAIAIICARARASASASSTPRDADTNKAGVARDAASPCARRHHQICRQSNECARQP
jgi:hypothetical protein